MRSAGWLTVGVRRDLLAVIALALTVGLFTTWWIHQDVNSFTLQTHGDQALIQASAQVAMQTGPFATSMHVGWFSGFNLWSFPAVSSLGFYGGAWLLGLFLSSSSNVLALLMGGVAASVAATSYVALRVVPPGRTSRLVCGLGAFALGLSPYVLSKMGHFNVASWYLIPTLLAVIALLPRVSSRGRQLALLALLSVVSLLSPLWWSYIALYVLLVVGVLASVLRRLAWVRVAVAVSIAVAVGTALPTLLAITQRIPGGSWNRQPWDSVFFGGSLFDVVFASPWLTRLWPGAEELTPALSRELSPVGLVVGVTTIFAIVASLTAFLGFSERWRRHRWVFIATQVSLLAFLSMGLGPVQEAVLFAVGVESPLRVWSRLIIIVGLFGMVMLVPWLSWLVSRAASSGTAGRIGVAGASLALAAVVVIDAFGIELMTPRTLPDLPEGEAVAYLQAEYGPCPVAQLPTGTFPDFPMFDGTPEAIDYFYRGYVPYLLAPDGYWSFGAPLGTPTDALMRSLPPDVSSNELRTLADAGYCAVLFDTEYADWLQRRGGDWPAMRIQGAVPEWQNQRFAVFSVS